MNPNEANEQRELSFTPPHNAITQKRIPVNDAVLKLGCFSINRINKPNSSAKIAKIKSVYMNGRYCNFCIESPKPWPNRPPEPIANKL